MNYAIAFVSVILFALGFRVARIAPVAADAVAQAKGAVRLLSSRTASEAEKEAVARAAALTLFGRCFVLIGLTAGALLPAGAIIAVAAGLGVADVPKIFAALSSPWLIAAALLLFALDYRFRR